LERRSCRDFRLHHAAVLGSHAGTSVVASLVAEIQLMSREMQPATKSFFEFRLATAGASTLTFALYLK
jgi:hypothetical protein